MLKYRLTINILKLVNKEWTNKIKWIFFINTYSMKYRLCNRYMGIFSLKILKKILYLV